MTDNLKFPRPSADICSRDWDVVVVGGGITGAGIAQDAAVRGLRTILVDKGDFASGTSSKSTKLIHGGLRYLENFQFRVTLESVRERQVQQALAPHMVWSVPFVYPKYSHKRLKNAKLGVGLWVYDLMAVGFANIKLHKSISREEVLRLCPGIDANGLTGGFVYYDCRTDDARHTLEVIKSACEHGATALNYAKVVGFVREGGRIAGVDIACNLPGTADKATYRLKGAVVINATGVWTQRTTELSGTASDTRVVPAKGIHITLSADRLPLGSAMIVPSVRDKRFCFAIPWYDSIVIGTTDTAYEGDLDKVRVEPDEIRYILEAVNAQFPNARVTEADVTGTYAGLRPLITEAGKTSTADISREHKLEVSPEGLISIAGGKLTTYRRMAKTAVDVVVRELYREAPALAVMPCTTDKVMLGGWTGENAQSVAHIMAMHEDAARGLGLSADTAAYLPKVYGRRAIDVTLLIKGDRTLGERLAPNHPYIKAQVLYAVRAEGARTIDDVLDRRIRLTITDKRAALACAETVSKLMASELGWNETVRTAHLERFRKDWV